LSDIISTTLIAKIFAGIGGLVGGAIFMAFMRPKNVWDAAIRSSVSTIVATVGAGPALNWLKFPTNWEMILLAGTILGFCAWSVLTVAARTLIKIEDDKMTVLDFWNKK
jgi:hypothetical protein